jgi:hypothetical protein
MTVVKHLRREVEFRAGRFGLGAIAPPVTAALRTQISAPRQITFRHRGSLRARRRRAQLVLRVPRRSLRQVRRGHPLQGRTRRRVPVPRPPSSVPIPHEGDLPGSRAAGPGRALHQHIISLAVRGRGDRRRCALRLPSRRRRSARQSRPPRRVRAASTDRLLRWDAARLVQALLSLLRRRRRSVWPASAGHERRDDGPFDEREPVLSETRSSAGTPFAR